jgi:hypothetical protein
MSANLFEIMGSAQSGDSIDSYVKGAISGYSAPSNWGAHERVAIILAMGVDSSVGCQLLTTTQWSQFYALVETAIANYNRMSRTSEAQQNLFSAIAAVRRYV